MRKKPKQSTLRKKADAVFSKFIRARDKGKCYTCGLQKDPKEMQCGHFSPRQYLATRYDEKNNHCQCYACNMFYNGQPATYALNLVRDYGEGIIKELEAKKWLVVRDFDYQAIIDKYTNDK